MSPDVDSTGEDGQKGDSLARACARRPETHSDGDETLVAADVTAAELEAVAVEIERAAPRDRETIHDIIAGHPAIRRVVVANAIRCLSARRWWYDAKKKKRVDEPDYQLRFRALEFLADRADGRPAQSLMTFNLNASANRSPDDEEEMKKALSSPALREELKRQIAAAERQENDIVAVGRRGAGVDVRTPAEAAHGSANG